MTEVGRQPRASSPSCVGRALALVPALRVFPSCGAVLRPFFYLPFLYSSHDLFPVLTPRKRLLHATPLTTALWLGIRPLTLATSGCYAAPRRPTHPALPLHGRPSCLVLPWLLGCFWRGTTSRSGMARQLRISFSKLPSARHEIWDDGYPSKGVEVRHKAVAHVPMTRQGTCHLNTQRQRPVRPDHRFRAVVFGASCACGRRSRHLTGEQQPRCGEVPCP